MKTEKCIGEWIKKAYQDTDIYEIVNINKREIYWTDFDSIDGQTVQKMLSLLDKLEEIDSKKDVTIKLNNDGGNPSSSLIFIDRIKSLPFKVNVHGEGMIASAATILLMGATGKKTMSPYAHMMFHQISSWSFGSEKKEDTKSRMQYYDSLTHMIIELYIYNSNIKTKEEWDNLLLKDNYFNANKCLELGIISDIK